MNSVVRIPDEYAARVNGADPERLERAALKAVLRATDDGERAALIRPAARPDLPVWHLGGVGDFHRRDIYDVR